MVARFTRSPIIGRPGQPIHFIDLSTESPTSWLWTFYDLDGTTVLGTSTVQNPYFTFPTAAPADCYRVTLHVIETGTPTSPPTVPPGDPDPPPTFPPTDPPADPTDDPPPALVAGRTLEVDSDLTAGQGDWSPLSGPTSRDGEVQIFDPTLVTFDGDGMHLALETDTTPTGVSGIHWGYDVTQDNFNRSGGFSAAAKAALSSIPNNIVNVHIGGFGVYPPEYEELGQFDWGGEIRGVPANGLDDTVAQMRQMINPNSGHAMITFCQAPGFMKASGLDFSMEEFPEPGSWADFADLCAGIAHRYPDVKYFQVWNELKGLFDSGLNRYRYEDYTDLYNLVWAAVKAVRPDALIGGPYPVFSSWTSGAPASDLGEPPLTFVGGEVDGRVLDVMGYWRDNCTGFDFICVDAWVANQFPTFGQLGASNFAQLDKFVQIALWVRANVHATKPIMFSEFYPSAGGATEATVAGWVIEIMTRMRDAGLTDVVLQAWGEAVEPGQPIDYDTGMAKPIVAMLQAWEAGQGGGGATVGPYRTGGAVLPLFAGAGLYAFKFAADPPHGPHVRSSLYLLSPPGFREVATYEDPSLDSTHYFTRTVNPNTPSQPVLIDRAGGHIVAVDINPMFVQWYLDWYPLNAPVTDPATVLAINTGQYRIRAETAVGGPWAGTPNLSTDTYIGTSPELVLEWFKRWGPRTGGGGPVGGGGATWQVPLQGSLQSVVDGAAPGDTIFVSGLVTVSGKGLVIANRRNGDAPITIYGNAGSVLRCSESGIEGFGSNRGWVLQNLNIEVDGSSYYGEGIYFHGGRTDFGGDGQGASDIRVLGCKVRPISGTGSVQRNGIAVWGADVVEIADCDVADAAYNDLGFFGGAGSGISCGEMIGQSSRPSLPNGARLWIHDNTINGMAGPGTASADRNGIILDLFQSQGSGLYPNRLHGLVIIEGNDISDCEGRGIENGWGGTTDTQIRVLNNTVHGTIASNLGGSDPVAAIGGYGGTIHGNMVVSGNAVTATLGGASAYKFIDFPLGVTGSGNSGSPVVFENSPTNTAPVGFT